VDPDGDQEMGHVLSPGDDIPPFVKKSRAKVS